MKYPFVLFTFAFLASFCFFYHFVIRYENGFKSTFCRSNTEIEELSAVFRNSREESDVNTANGFKGKRKGGHVYRIHRRLPQCIIIGVRKGGTRALLEFLNIHPSVQKASDEVHFFDDDSKYELGLEWYRRQMPYSFPEQVTIEKSPAYFVTESAPYRIHAMNSSVKLLLIVRDPVTRLISDYAQLAENKAKKERRVATFEQVVLLADGSVNTNYKPVRTSIYSLYYTRWIQVFPGHQIHIVDGDRLVYDPFPEVQRVERFLGLPHRISRENFSYNATKGFYCVKLNGTVEKCLNESKGRPHPDVDPVVVQTLRRFYSPFNRKFYKMVKKDFGWPEF
ncbi:heparan sulfate glucosamine 3-O-sulfotransferase 5-like protein [Leptotrombidium deliense]|uniref:Heparan sulfate glucosamine 3-O-sulfotransferase 5 n=1 Tax=Leptotrombidium deliense TaxID=299467 RepID=A0A443SGS2_9ACAR|nr:heparan sulfate glucosamine 3-O-sulfotransferase 5-like protein [Leptotrombidium deliense]